MGLAKIPDPQMLSMDVAQRIKSIVGKEIEIEVKEIIDNRSYKICSDKIKDELDFVPKYEIEDAVKELIDANNNNKFTDPLSNSLYYNIKKMKEIKLT